ncbi:hypothetical protein KR084_004743, partial [Drosophila pseudotakahashii]
NTYRLTLDGTPIKHSDTAKYLGLTLDRRLTWKQHIVATCASVRQKAGKVRWLLRPGSGLSITAKTRLFKATLMPSLHWGIHFWGTACNTSIKRVESCQSKMLRHMINAPYYTRNTTIFRDLKSNPVCKSITNSAIRYRSRLISHTNRLALTLSRPMNRRRLKRLHPSDNWILGRHASGKLI